MLLQTRPPNLNAERLVDEVVGRLIGSEGMDLILVESFSSMTEGSVDRLPLETLSGDLAILDWLSPERIVEGWNGLGFDGYRAPHRLDSEASPAIGQFRRIYAFNLSEADSADSVLQGLKEIHAGRQVRTVTLDGISPTKLRSQAAEGQAAKGQASDSGEQNQSQKSRDWEGADSIKPTEAERQGSVPKRRLEQTNPLISQQSGVSGVVEDSGAGTDRGVVPDSEDDRTSGGQLPFQDAQSNPLRKNHSEKHRSQTDGSQENIVDLDELLDELDRLDL